MTDYRLAHNPISRNSPVNKLLFAGEGRCNSYDVHGRPYIGTRSSSSGPCSVSLLWTPNYYMAYGGMTSYLAESHDRPHPLFLVKKEQGAKFLVINMHANYVDAGDEVENSVELASAWDAHVLIPEYPGYCVAPGDATVQDVAWGVMSAAFFAIYILGVPNHRIILFGRSIGTGAATLLARTLSHRPAPLGPPAALILQSPYTSIREVAKTMGGAIGCLSNLLFDRFQTRRHLPYIDAPVLIMHGDRDEVIPFQHGCENHGSREGVPWATEMFVQKNCTHSEFNHRSHVTDPGRLFISKYCSANQAGLVNVKWAAADHFKAVPRDAGGASRTTSKVLQAGGCCCVTCALLGEAIIGGFNLGVRAIWRNIKYGCQKYVCGHGS